MLWVSLGEGSDMTGDVNVEGFQRDRYFSRSWALLTRDRGWVKPVLVLAVAALVPIVGPLALLGYALEWARLTAWGVSSAPKQRGVRVGECIGSGWRGFVVAFVWVLVTSLVARLLLMIPLAGGTLYFAWRIFSIFLGMMVPVAMLRATIYQKIVPGLNVCRVWQMATHDVAGLFRILGMNVVACLVIGLATFLVAIAGFAASLASLVYSVQLLQVNASIMSTRMFYAQVAQVVMQFLYAMGPTLAVVLVIDSIGAVVMSLLGHTAYALWIRQFDIPSWKGERDPLPPFVMDPRDQPVAPQPQYAQQPGPYQGGDGA